MSVPGKRSKIYRHLDDLVSENLDSIKSKGIRQLDKLLPDRSAYKFRKIRESGVSGLYDKIKGRKTIVLNYDDLKSRCDHEINYVIGHETAHFMNDSNGRVKDRIRSESLQHGIYWIYFAKLIGCEIPAVYVKCDRCKEEFEPREISYYPETGELKIDSHHRKDARAVLINMEYFKELYLEPDTYENYFMLSRVISEALNKKKSLIILDRAKNIIMSSRGRFYDTDLYYQKGQFKVRFKRISYGDFLSHIFYDTDYLNYGWKKDKINMYKEKFKHCLKEHSNLTAPSTDA
ncbi:hypothetical protein M1293_02100 [Candidatus Parvarchaeota archaeon]|nr:hypothetical protein [Candidatus Parvarchaeota archaeon]